MNVIFTCGGTGGHINPAIAVANRWKERYPDSNILFIGAAGGMEEQLVPKAGFELVTLSVDGIYRGIGVRSLIGNFKALHMMLSSINRCKQILKDFNADIVVGTGGYASLPALVAAGKLKIPCCVHEANAEPGLTTRLVAPMMGAIMVCFPQSAQYYKEQDKVHVVGMPVRGEFIYNKKAECRKKLGLDERPVILSAYGSQGAMTMNEVTAELIRMEKEAGFPYQHIHASGSFGWRWLPELIEEKGVEVREGGPIYLQEYIYDMPTAMVAADIVLSRAGASSCNEIAVAGIPCILIPSPNVTANHQEKNARAMVEKGAAVMILEDDCYADVVMEKIKGLLEDPKAYDDMRKALMGIAIPDSAERICSIMKDLIAERSKN